VPTTTTTKRFRSCSVAIGYFCRGVEAVPADAERATAHRRLGGAAVRPSRLNTEFVILLYPRWRARHTRESLSSCGRNLLPHQVSRKNAASIRNRRRGKHGTGTTSQSCLLVITPHLIISDLSMDNRDRGQCFCFNLVVTGHYQAWHPRRSC